MTKILYLKSSLALAMCLLMVSCGPMVNMMTGAVSGMVDTEITLGSGLTHKIRAKNDAIVTYEGNGETIIVDNRGPAAEPGILKTIVDLATLEAVGDMTKDK